MTQEALVTVEQRTRNKISEQLNRSLEEVTPEAHLVHDLGADSLDIIEVVMALEEEFDIEIPDEEAEKLLTVADCVNYVANATGE